MADNNYSDMNPLNDQHDWKEKPTRIERTFYPDEGKWVVVEHYDEKDPHDPGDGYSMDDRFTTADRHEQAPPSWAVAGFIITVVFATIGVATTLLVAAQKLGLR